MTRMQSMTLPNGHRWRSIPWLPQKMLQMRSWDSQRDWVSRRRGQMTKFILTETQQQRMDTNLEINISNHPQATTKLAQQNTQCATRTHGDTMSPLTHWHSPVGPGAAPCAGAKASLLRCANIASVLGPRSVGQMFLGDFSMFIPLHVSKW